MKVFKTNCTERTMHLNSKHASHAGFVGQLSVRHRWHTRVMIQIVGVQNIRRRINIDDLQKKYSAVFYAVYLVHGYFFFLIH